MSTTTTGLHPVMAAALAPLFARPQEEAQNWVMLGADGMAIWMVYATSREAALLAYTPGFDARPMNDSPEDHALNRRVRASWGSCS
jgi:hypothetical protein